MELRGQDLWPAQWTVELDGKASAALVAEINAGYVPVGRGGQVDGQLFLARCVARGILPGAGLPAAQDQLTCDFLMDVARRAEQHHPLMGRWRLLVLVSQSIVRSGHQVDPDSWQPVFYDRMYELDFLRYHMY